MSLLDKKIEDYVRTSSLVEFECDEFDDYSFPKEENVPEDWYYSMIVGVRNGKTSKGEDCIDVFHKLLTKKEMYLYDSEKIDSLSYLYIKQRYKRGSDAEREFKNAMKAHKLPPKFTGDDLIGIIEGIRIEYSKSGWGNIAEREPNHADPSWFEDDIPKEE